MTHVSSQQAEFPTGAIVDAIATADDPCEVVEDAIPALVIGDLHARDEAAVTGHCAECHSCNTMLGAWESGLAEAPPPADASPPPAAPLLGLQEGYYGLMESPLGDLLLVVTEDGVAEIGYLGSRGREAQLAELEARGILASERSSRVEPVRDQLREYFDHQRTQFTLPVDLHGVTQFTQQVLHATLHVPFGDVRTYQGIATAIGRPKASRAVGNALGRNPVPVIVPCHRVVRADGSMGWYTGGSQRKQKLLGIEGVAFPQPAAQPGLAGLGDT